MLEALIGPVTGLLDKFVEDKDQKARLAHEIATMAEKYAHESALAQVEDAGAKVDAIQVRQFDWKADGSHQDYGMIAQELLTVAPEAVSGDPESDEMMGVDYSKLVPMLVKEIQSLRARVHALEGK